MVSCWDRQETGSWTSWKVTVPFVLPKRRVIKNFTEQRQRSSADGNFRWNPWFHVFKVAFFLSPLQKKKVLALTLTKRSEVLTNLLSPETVCTSFSGELFRFSEPEQTLNEAATRFLPHKYYSQGLLVEKFQILPGVEFSFRLCYWMQTFATRQTFQGRYHNLLIGSHDPAEGPSSGGSSVYLWNCTGRKHGNITTVTSAAAHLCHPETSPDRMWSRRARSSGSSWYLSEKTEKWVLSCLNIISLGRFDPRVTRTASLELLRNSKENIWNLNIIEAGNHLTSCHVSTCWHTVKQLTWPRCPRGLTFTCSFVEGFMSSVVLWCAASAEKCADQLNPAFLW